MAAVTEAPAALFASPAALRSEFERRLEAMLHDGPLGVFILVLANASFERAMFDRLRGPLDAAFARWCEAFDRGEARALDAPADDVEVFRRLRGRGLDRLGVTRWRRLGPWELQFNPLRAFRPPRMSGAAAGALRRPFDPSGFHFDRPFLRREILWEGDLAGTPARLLYNKFPFAELHGLLVPEPASARSQFLERRDHGWLWRIGTLLGERLPGIGFGYNALGAYASVNHLHFQMFLRGAGAYPIESLDWRHNGGAQPYPLPVQRHDDPDSAWSALERLHAAGVTYNLLYRPGLVYVVPRAPQGSCAPSDWTGGLAWSETAGTVTTFDAADFERLDAGEIEAELAGLAVRP